MSNWFVCVYCIACWSSFSSLPFWSSCNNYLQAKPASQRQLLFPLPLSSGIAGFLIIDSSHMVKDGDLLRHRPHTTDRIDFVIMIVHHFLFTFYRSTVWWHSDSESLGCIHRTAKTYWLRNNKINIDVKPKQDNITIWRDWWINPYNVICSSPARKFIY